jgi:TRAP-type uncharacterized transport system substrate-binding protein
MPTVYPNSHAEEHAIGRAKAEATIRAMPLATAIAVLCLLPAVSGWAQQTDAVISTGHQGGSYYYIGNRLRTTMQVQHELRIANVTSSGSVQNLARLADPSSDVGLALTQTDALSQFLASNADFTNEFIVLGDAGKECAVLIAGKNGQVHTFGDLKKKTGGEISVDDPGSGASVTFGYLQAMDSSLAQLKPVFVDTIEALLQIKVAGQHTNLKAVMLVQRPSIRSAPVRILLENPNDYHLLPIVESDVENSKLPDGSVVYTFEKVNIGATTGDRSLDVETICTRGLLLASKRKLSRDLRSKLSKAMLQSSETVIGAGD